MEKGIFEFATGTKIYYGPGSSGLIGKEALKFGVTRAVIVTDRGVRQAGLVNSVEKSLALENIASLVFDEVQEDADVNVIHQIALKIREIKADGVVVVGGGSPICAAKGAAIEATNEVASVRELGGWNKYKNPPVPLLCIPTTAGSGSDVSSGSPIYDNERKIHFGVRGDELTPKVSLLDPVLLETCPFRPMIYAGVDALSHAMEALWGTGSTPVSDMYAFEGIRLVMTNLREATYTRDLEAKTNQHLAATMGIIAGHHAGLGVLHGIAGAHFSYTGPHGYRCGILLPPVMEYSLPVCEAKFARMAAILGEPDEGSQREMAELFIFRVKQLLVDLQFPRYFDNDTYSPEKIDSVVNEVMENSGPFLATNKRKVTREDVTQIFQAAVDGWDI